MNKELLIKHIKGELPDTEKAKVISWIDKSKENEEYYLALMEAVIVEGATRETPVIELSHDEKRQAFSQIVSRISKLKRGYTQNGTSANIFAERASRKIKYLVSLAACAAILLFASVTLNFLQYRQSKSSLEYSVVEKISSDAAVAPVAMNGEQTFYTENGVKGRIVLPDSSIVWLNSGSSISYLQESARSERLVKFSGEGYFEVKRDENAPMIITTPRGMKVTVLGTKFHICSYNDDTEEQATLFAGKINISKVVDNRIVVKEKEIKPLETVNFRGMNKATLSANADTTKKIAWKNGKLLFDKTPMPDVIKKLERWHGVEIVVKDTAILRHSFTAKFSSESIVQILELMKFTTPVDFVVENNKVILLSRKN